MKLRRRIALLGIALALVAAPSLALAAAACSACCCVRPPCHDGADGCQMTFAADACCELTAAPLLPVAKRGVEAPPAAVLLPRFAAPRDDSYRVRPPVHTGDVACRASPLRLSVVLLV